MPQVAIFMGSKSDESTVRPCADVLEKLGISCTFTITSAHRTPERTSRLIKELEEDGVQVFICAAGLAAHLAGAVAAKTVRPVLGIPISASSLGGWDALLATVQMPPDFLLARWLWTRSEHATRPGLRPRFWPSTILSLRNGYLRNGAR